MKKRMAAIMFVICVIVLIMLTAGFEQDKLSTAEYLIYSALALGGMYISKNAAKKETPAEQRKCGKRQKKMLN